MAVDFFKYQETARKKTGRLIFFFLLAVAGIIALLYLAACFAFGMAEDRADWLRFDPGLFAIVAGVVIVIVGLASWYKTSQLKGGGAVVAQSMRGRRILPGGAKDFHERKLLNVVEEMAIASGVPVPPVYVMDHEESINAFAAGTSPGNAVVGVTRGCMRKLSRDELQGVIAHEFSHILNGDMKLSIKLIGVIHGILVIGLLGYITMRIGFSMMRGSSRSRSKEGGGAMAVLLGVALLGAICWLIGYLGTFFANIIKSGVSRQREYLADASAVQFTRHPKGIAGALKKIGGFPTGSKVNEPRSREISHMFFGQAFSSWLGKLNATHPPLPKRIGRLDPQFDGTFARVTGDAPKERLRAASFAGAAEGSVAEAKPVDAVLSKKPDGGGVAQIGRPTQAHVTYARELIEGLPGRVRKAAGEPFGARAVIYALLLNREPEPRQLQFDRLEKHADPGVFRKTRILAGVINHVDPNARLPLIDLCLPVLRELTPDQYTAFRGNAMELIQADSEMDPFEWVLWRIIKRHLEPQFTGVHPPKAKFKSLKPVRDECGRLLTLLAWVGADSDASAEKAFSRATDALGLTGLSLPPRTQADFGQLYSALGGLALLHPKLKKKVLTAAAECIAADRKITVEEGELFRAIADTLDCPMPPLLPGQPLTG